MSIEKRQYKRVPLETPIKYQEKGSYKYFNSIGKNISEGGIGFVSYEFFPVSCQLVFEVQHPENRKFITALAEVVWIREEPHSERFSIGARFINPPVAI